MVLRHLFQIHFERVLQFCTAIVTYIAVANLLHGQSALDRETFASLRPKIEEILNKESTPGAGIAVVSRAGNIWVDGIGLADVTANRPADALTLFRIGSISKAFVSLSVLKLQSEGKINLQDTLRSRAPDLVFKNPWEESAPVRIVDLLEHTAGWDDLGLGKYSFDKDAGQTLEDGLAATRISRISRWKPGTRYSYSNAGPSVAAYVVEKVTGERFEEYVEKTWFRPLGMEHVSYFESPYVEKTLTKLYYPDGRRTYRYWPITLRPSGSINASATDLAKLLIFYLNRGSVNGVELLPSSSIDRSERPTTTYGAQQGLESGYGLGNYTMINKGLVFHGHQGGVPGGVAELAYLREFGVGYVILLNSGSMRALEKIRSLICDAISRSLPEPSFPEIISVALPSKTYSGWYENITPRMEIARPFLRILQLSRIQFKGSKLILGRALGKNRTYLPVTDRLFRLSSESVPTLALIGDYTEGVLAEVSGVSSATLRRIPTWEALTEIIILIAATVLMLSTVAFAVVWIPRRFFGSLRNTRGINVRMLPLVATLCLMCAILGPTLTFFNGSFFDYFGRASMWSLGFSTSTIGLGIFSHAGVIQALRWRNKGINRFAWGHSFAVSSILALVTLYLAYWGIIGVRLWT